MERFSLLKLGEVISQQSLKLWTKFIISTGSVVPQRMSVQLQLA
jgi:hypothetical protein